MADDDWYKPEVLKLRRRIQKLTVANSPEAAQMLSKSFERTDSVLVKVRDAC